MTEIKFGKVILAITVVLAALILIFGSFGTIDTGTIGIKTRLGAVVGVAQPGLYFKLPLIEDVKIIDVKTRTIDYDKNGNEGDSQDSSQLSGSSKDLQNVWLGVVVNYHIDPSKADLVFSQYSSTGNYEYNVIEPIIRQVVKSIAAQYTADELVTKRPEMSEKVTQMLSDSFSEKFSILETASITNFQFSKAFADAIEAKVTATQNAEAAKNKLEQVKFEAQQQVETAKAQAEAIKIQAQAINSQGGADYVQLQAIEKWNGVLPNQFVPGSAVPFLNLN